MRRKFLYVLLTVLLELKEIIKLRNNLIQVLWFSLLCFCCCSLRMHSILQKYGNAT